LLNKALEIDDVSVDHFRISLGHTGAPPVPESEIGTVQTTATTPPTPSQHGWLNPKLDLRQVEVHETDVLWGENTTQAGSVTDSELTVTPDGDAWNILIQGGTISQKGGPDMKLDHIKAHYQTPSWISRKGYWCFRPAAASG